jgi:hypothetical protein
VSPLFRRGDDTNRAPLAGQLVGLALGVIALTIALNLAFDLIVELLQLGAPLLALFAVYAIFMRSRRR